MLSVQENVVLSGIINYSYSPLRVSSTSLQAIDPIALCLKDIGE